MFWKSGPCKVLKNELVLEKSWNLLGNDSFGRFWLQKNMFLQTKTAIIVTTRYVLWAAGMPKRFLRVELCPGFHWGSLECSTRPHSCSLLLYLNIAGLRQGPRKMLLGFWKSTGIVVTERMGTVYVRNSLRFPVPCIYATSTFSLSWSLPVALLCLLKLCNIPFIWKCLLLCKQLL